MWCQLSQLLSLLQNPWNSTWAWMCSCSSPCSHGTWWILACSRVCFTVLCSVGSSVGLPGCSLSCAGMGIGAQSLAVCLHPLPALPASGRGSLSTSLFSSSAHTGWGCLLFDLAAPHVFSSLGPACLSLLVLPNPFLAPSSLCCLCCALELPRAVPLDLLVPVSSL